MQSHNAYPDPLASSPAAYNNGAANTPVGSAEPYVHPTIPLGLPHVVQFVEASLHHLPMSVRFVGDRLSRYGNAKGEVSMAASFLCHITGLGSRNTADHHLRLIESLGVMEKRPGKGGKDRKSNTYVFLGEDRNWKPLPTERPGTDPWVALARSRRENEALRSEIEELQAELARLMNAGPIAHSELSNGSGEGQEYLARRDRVESLVMKQRAYYDRSFHRRGVLGAIEYFSRSAENEQELVRQVGILDAGQDPARASNEARQQTEGPPPPVNPESGRREVEYCPDCGSPYTTFNGEERCPDCTGRRRRESEA